MVGGRRRRCEATTVHLDEPTVKWDAVPLQDLVRTAEQYRATPEVAALKDSALQLVAQILAMTNVADRHRKELLSIALWKWTEAEGLAPNAKYNLRYCSAGVMLASEPVRVNHEHVFTRRALLPELIEGEHDLDGLRSLLERKGVACVVTVDEHAALGNAMGSGWTRYAAAGIPVYDRAQRCWLDLAPPVGDPEKPLEGPAAGPTMAPAPSTPDVGEAIAKYGKTPAATWLIRLVRYARVASAVEALHRPRDGRDPKWFRIHDTLVEEPTAAVAYAKWNGDVDFALDPGELPERLRRNRSVTPRNDRRYRVRCRLTDKDSFHIAEALLALALERVRNVDGG